MTIVFYVKSVRVVLCGELRYELGGNHGARQLLLTNLHISPTLLLLTNYDLYFLATIGNNHLSLARIHVDVALLVSP